MKVRGLLALAGTSIIAMLGFGASTAFATGSTSLCTVNENPCAAGHLATSVGLTAGTVVLKTSLLTVLCLSSSIAGEIENGGLGNPLGIRFTSWTFSNCGSNAAHNNCTITTDKLPLLDVLNTGGGLGTATALNPLVTVTCGESLLCSYGGPGLHFAGFTVESALHQAGSGHGMLSAVELSLPREIGFLCPNEARFTALYEPNVHLYLSS